MTAPTVIHPTGGPIADSATGWPITTSAYASLGPASVEVALTDPAKDETVFVFDLTPHGAMQLASQLVEVARAVIREAGYCTSDVRRVSDPPCELHAPTRYSQ